VTSAHRESREPDEPYVSHVEWVVADLEQTEAFLRALFGWDFQALGPRYRLYVPADPNRVRVGLMQRRAGGAPCYMTLIHIQVDQIDPYLERTTALGGRVPVTRTPIPEYGFYAQVEDPDGNRIGLFEPSARS